MCAGRGIAPYFCVLKNLMFRAEGDFPLARARRTLDSRQDAGATLRKHV
jgi:hypothetical protein